MSPNELGVVENYINIRDLLYSVFKKLGIIIVAGCVVGGAMGGNKILNRVKTNNVLDETTRINSRETDIQYQERVQNIDRARDIASTIDRVNNQIEHQREYIADSIYMQIDAENEYETLAQFVVTLDKSELSGLDEALYSAYERDIRAGNFINEFADEYGTKPDYVRELISFSSYATSSVVLASESQVNRVGSIYIRVYGPSRSFCDQVMDIVITEVEREHAKLNTNIIPHKIELVGIQHTERIDSGLRDGQVNQTARLETLQKQIVSYNESLAKVAEQLGLSDTETILEYFAKHSKVDVDGVPTGTSEVTLGYRAMLKPAIKSGIIGFAIGAVLVGVLLILKYIFAVKISTQTQFFNEFTNVKKIGVMKPLGKRGKYATFIDIKSEDDSKMSAENTRKLIAANYENITKDLKKVLITGTGDSKAMGEAVKTLGIKGDFKPDIFSNPDILKAIPDYDAVVLLEQRKVSTFKTVTNEIKLIENTGTKIAGAIII